MQRHLLSFALSIVSVSVAGGCSMRQLAVNQTADILKDSLPAFEREWDVELVERALPANLKTLEAILVSAPENAGLLLTLARGYTAYGLVIIEDHLEQARVKAEDDVDDSPDVARHMLRAKDMYQRAHGFGVRAMEARRAGYGVAFTKGREVLKKYLAIATKDDVPALFWSAMPLAAALNIDRNDVKLLAQMPKVRAIMVRLTELDGSYYYGGAHMVLGGLFGSVGKILGGDTARAKKHFEMALTMTKRRFLLVQEMYARTLAVQLQDEKLFKKLLNEVITAAPDILAEQRLANEAAKRRAKRTLKKLDELF